MEMTEVTALLGVPDLAEAVGRVEAVMTDLLGSADASLSEPCLRILRGRGKRLRPALVIAAAACGPQAPDRPTVLSAAAAVELIHIGSLVHDDIMDRAEDRRGVPSISFREGLNVALLCGDVLFALAGHAAARVSRTAAIESAEAIVALCNGQIREMVDNFNPSRSEQSILASMEGKTAALLRTSCRLGGICGNMNPEEIDALGAYGRDFGMSFQLVDDVLDFLSSHTQAGKPVLNDVRCGVFTLPVALALREEYGRELVDALEPIDGDNGHGIPRSGRPGSGRPGSGGPGPNADLTAAQLTDAQVETASAILRSGDYFRRVLDLAMDYARRAGDHLSCLPDTPTARGLARLPSLYVELQFRTVEDEGLLGVRASTNGS